MKRINYAILCDIDGVLVIERKANKGAINFLRYLEKNNVPYCLLTNSGEISKVMKIEFLNEIGIKVFPERIVTALELTEIWLLNNNIKRIIFLGSKLAKNELSKFVNIKDDADVDAVVVADWFDEYSKSKLKSAYEALQRGALLIAVHVNRTWGDGKEQHIDLGFWVKGFEYVSNRSAIIIGKPSKFSYEYAIERLNFRGNRRDIIFISDDYKSDLHGAKDCSLTTLYFGSEIIESEVIDLHAKNFEEICQILE